MRENYTQITSQDLTGKKDAISCRMLVSLLSHECVEIPYSWNWEWQSKIYVSFFCKNSVNSQICSSLGALNPILPLLLIIITGIKELNFICLTCSGHYRERHSAVCRAL